MKVLQINSMYGLGSTGKIVKNIGEKGELNGFDMYYAYSIGSSYTKNSFRVSSLFSKKVNTLLSRVKGNHGLNNRRDTENLISWINLINPDIIHLHNLHGNYVNFKLLFEYLSEIDKPIIWTLHDCLSFTGNCAHFDYINCDKWRKNCRLCPDRKLYPKSYFFDRAEELLSIKKSVYSDVNKLHLVTPSIWLYSKIDESILSNIPKKVINNGIDLTVFKPTYSNIRERYFLKDKKIILGVAFAWGQRKGLDVFIELSKTLSSKYQIVLIGISKKIKKELPNNILSIERTNDKNELAQFYSTADIFLNPTREDTFPTTNIESLACGTPVITFNTGGSSEIIDRNSGIIVKDNIDEVAKAIRFINKTENMKKNCIQRASSFSKDEKYKEYINLYRELNRK